MASNSEMKKRRAELREDLRKLLTGKHEGIPVDKLHSAYNKKFHKDVSLRACGLKLATVGSAFPNLIEEVTINHKNSLRLKQNSKGAKGDPGGKPKAGASAGAQKKPAASKQQTKEPSSSKKPAPVALTVPQYAFEPVPKKPPAEKRVSEKKKSADRDKDSVAADEKSEPIQGIAKPSQENEEPSVMMGGPVQMQQQPGQVIVNPLEFQMQHYIAGRYGPRGPAVGPPGVHTLVGPPLGSHMAQPAGASVGHPGVHALVGPPLGLLGPQPAGAPGRPFYFGDNLPPGGAGQFTFDQGSMLSSQDPQQLPKSNAAEGFSLDKYYDRQREESTPGASAPKSIPSSTSTTKVQKAPAAATKNTEDSENWPSLAEAKSAVKPKTTVAKQTPSSGKQTTNKAVPLMSVSTSNVRSSAPKHQSYDDRNRSSRNTGRTYYGRSKYPRSQIDDFAQNCIVNLAEAGDYVSIERVMMLVMQHFQVEQIEELGLRGEYELDSIKALQRLQKKVNLNFTNISNSKELIYRYLFF